MTTGESMTDQNEETKAAEGEVVQAESRHEMAILKELVEGIADPLVKGQLEETKRTELLVGLYEKLASKLFWIVVLILAIAGLALWKGEPQLTEKVIIALISFIGGLGLGKGLGKS